MKKDRSVLRIVDANLNRLTEALRVCEDAVRFDSGDRKNTERLKKIRHDIRSLVTASSALKYADLVSARDARRDVGTKTIAHELERGDCRDILAANMQRAKESARVLEEFSKVVDTRAAARFKRIRFRIYDTEKALIGTE